MARMSGRKQERKESVGEDIKRKKEREDREGERKNEDRRYF